MVRARRNRGVDVDMGGGWESAGTDPGTQRAHRLGRRDWPEGHEQAGRTDRRAGGVWVNGVPADKAAKPEAGGVWVSPARCPSLVLTVVE